MQQVCIFEDHYYAQLVPLVYTRATFELRYGLFTSLDRIRRHYPHAVITLFCRSYLSEVLQERYLYSVNSLEITENTILFLNGRAAFSTPVSPEGEEEVGIQNDTIVYARLKGENARKISPEMLLTKDGLAFLEGRVPFVGVQIPGINYFWDVINLNKSRIEKDFLLFVKEGFILGKLCDGVHLINKDQIFIGKDSQIKPCCVVDAEKGPIYIGDYVTIAPNTTISGPVNIGSHSVVQPGSKLREGTNIGDHCKIGGEIVNTIFHSYSNKQHDGFLGDSYIGSWVNIGANTVNSNLLNTYGNIRVRFGSDFLNTEQMFLGMAMGDNTKTAINTTIMTGSIFGFACNIVTTNYPPKYLPSFTWYSSNGAIVYVLEKALQVARVAMKRRNREMTQAEEKLFKLVFHLTEGERVIIE